MGNLKITLFIRKELTFVLRTGKVVLPRKGPLEPGCQTATFCCASAHPFSTTPLSQEATRLAGSWQELLSLDQVLGLYNFLRGGESQKNGYLQVTNSDWNRAKELYITWIFPSLPHCSCPISKHRTRKVSPQISGIGVLGFAGISDGPLGKLYVGVSFFGICC